MNNDTRGISQDLMAAIFNTSEFRKYSHDCRQDIVEALKDYQFNTLLDLDCGSGLMLEQIFEAFPLITANGFDYSLERLAGAKERLADKDVTLNFGNAKQLPYKKDSFDMVVSTSTFHHYPYPHDVLEEIHRVLKPKGTLIICDTYLNAAMRYLNIVSRPINEVTDIRMYSEKDIWQMLGKAGFTGIQWKKLNKYTYMAKADASSVLSA
ncbi:class I SAM-dependent methyltransferase [Eubacterium barkeri]|uniref:Ubiquinone/menaquinone biosynthesis C-methylase UbiE n=1 Tax=Eubacterium barkeri TaxID=1528 RepID=A0A1H3J773_EUBBA|nr:class I SAM-dependent methyltransferase [Eubacterium barkeri]SDY35811.1 Ubiquinone/menaquinone biosynthesis C-methylase UbiE [Eubacterium barkeri]